MKIYVLLVLALLMISPSSCAQNAAHMDKKISNKLTLEQISEIIRIALPPGTTLAEVDKYFTDNNIEHGFSKNTNRILAMIHNIRGGHWPVQKDAQIIITFDQVGNLANIEVKPVFTGP
jgi:hypothetical protein